MLVIWSSKSVLKKDTANFTRRPGATKTLGNSSGWLKKRRYREREKALVLVNLVPKQPVRPGHAVA